MTTAKVLSSTLRKYRAAVDASDTGVGKTFTALGVARLLEQTPLVVCPKSVRSAWREAADALGIPVLDILNVEKLKTGNTPYLDRAGRTFIWRLPRDTLVIWDEVQNAGGIKSQNGKILALTRAYGLPVLGLSATIADNPLKLKALGYLLGLHQYKNHYDWCLKNGCVKSPFGNGRALEFTRSPVLAVKYMKQLHGAIFPERGQRVRIADLDVFPDNAVFAEAYDLDKYTDEINEVYAHMLEELQQKGPGDNALTIMLRARQKAEVCKLSLLLDLTGNLLEENKSVVVFVNFKETLDRLISDTHSYSPAVIRGEQTGTTRDEEIRRFQADGTRLCLAMIQAGGVGVSLHDTHGNHPRVSLITPSFNAVHMKQALGRIHRAGAKTKCLQKIIFAAGTVEENACAAVRRKLDNLDALNDGDLSGLIVDV